MAVAQLGYEIDSSGAVKAAGDLDKMTAAAIKTETQSNALKSATAQLNSITGTASKQFIALKSSEDSAFAAAVKLQKAQDTLNAELKAGTISAAQMEASIENLTTKYQSQIAVAGKFNTAMQGSTAQTANLGAQLNDIGVMLAAGQSPLQLAVQQGTQINQVFAQMGGGKQALRGLAAGFMSMVNPMSLATIGIIAGGAALVGWARDAWAADDAAISFEDAVDDLSEAISGIDAVFENAGMGMVSLSARFGDLADEMQVAFGIIRDLELKTIQDGFRNISDEVANQTGLWDSMKQSLRGFTGEQAKVEALAATFSMTSGEAYNLLENLNAIENADTFDDAATKAADLLFVIKETEGPIEDLDGPMAVLVERLATLVDLAGSFNEQMGGASSVIADAEYQTFLAYQAYGESRLAAPDEPVKHRTTQARRGGGGSKRDEFAENLDRLRESLRNEREVVDEWHVEQQELLNNRRAVEILGIEGHNEAKLRLEEEYQERLGNIHDSSNAGIIGGLGTFFGEAEGLMSSGNKALFEVGKAAAIANATVNSIGAAEAAWEKGMQIGGPPVAAAFAGLSVLSSAARIAALKSATFSGSSSTSASTGSAATSATAPVDTAPAQQLQEAIIQVQGDFLSVDQLDKIVKYIQGEASDGVIIRGVVQG